MISNIVDNVDDGFEAYCKRTFDKPVYKTIPDHILSLYKTIAEAAYMAGSVDMFVKINISNQRRKEVENKKESANTQEENHEPPSHGDSIS